MKRFILIFATIVMAIGSVCAQNANRSGFFVELQGGVAVGNALNVSGDKRYSYNWEGTFIVLPEEPYIKGGGVGYVDFGYRFRISRPLALELKIGANGNFADIEKIFSLRAMPGLRWTSKEFTGNKSFFIAFNAGVSLSRDFYQVAIPAEFSFGVNLSTKFYIGLFGYYAYNIDHDLAHDESYKGYWLTYAYPSNSVNVGVRLGYRF